jgi:hypothetical protein
LLLNEMQKQQDRIEKIEEQQQVIAALTGRLDTVEQRLGTEPASSSR